MKRARGFIGELGKPVLANVGARGGAMASLAIATLIVARSEGATGVGVLSLLRVLPPLIGVVFSSGLPAACPYFLAGPTRDDPRVRASIVVLALGGGIAGGVVWVIASSPIAREFFPGVDHGVLRWAGLTVLTQLLVVVSWSSLQGLSKLSSSNAVILMEELLFLPVYGILWASGVHGVATIVVGLVATDLLVVAFACRKLLSAGFFRDRAGPALGVIKTICGYGARSQLGNLLLLLNLRLDFLILGALTGPAVVGVYAVASKYAELLRLPSLGLHFVLYPRYARDPADEASRHAGSLLPVVAIFGIAAAVPLWFLAPYVLPAVFGEAFRAAVQPARILVVGLSLATVAGVIVPFLYGRGRPGLYSVAMGAGLLVTAALDFALVPRLHERGAAIASTVAYLVTSIVLFGCFMAIRRQPRSDADVRPQLGPATFP